jgi:hypothetical protein
MTRPWVITGGMSAGIGAEYDFYEYYRLARTNWHSRECLLGTGHKRQIQAPVLELVPVPLALPSDLLDLASKPRSESVLWYRLLIKISAISREYKSPIKVTPLPFT